jgi:2,4-dienoyl-CoA reductase-like NADH-dependent reductase (Old Yellow Enzyme family)
MKYQPLATIKSSEAFSAHLQNVGMGFPFKLLEEQDSSPLAEPFTLKDGFVIGNRFCIHPMEGWDGTLDGKPTTYTTRRWRNFGVSGAKLIWGGEAVAVCHEGRANPNQLLINPDTAPHLQKLLHALIDSHEQNYGTVDDLLVGLQLTHSGRFSKPNRSDKFEPKTLYRHPYLEKKFHTEQSSHILSDEEIEGIIQQFIHAAILAEQIGFQFVDIKHSHGYLGHEFLSARTRSGFFGGSFENRTRFLREIVAGIRQYATSLTIGVRVSAFDLIPYSPHPDTQIGCPVSMDGYPQPFGAAEQDFLQIDLTETTQFLQLCEELGVQLINLTAGSPYYNPHIQRPAMFPPSDGYKPPEDPILGVLRQIGVTASLKAEFPNLAIVGSAYSYLQEWLSTVAISAVAAKAVDFVGLGRMVLSYPEYPSVILKQQKPDKKRLCRTFSDCTTAPRCGLISGCYPLDHYYKNSPDYETLQKYKLAD